MSDPLAIVCGGGSLPFAVADAAIARGRRAVLYPLQGLVDPARLAAYRHHWIRLGQFGRFRRLLAEEDCRDVVFIGSLVRPGWRDMRFDLGMVAMLPTIVRAFRGGDDKLLTAMGRVMEEAGLRPLGAHEVAPEILVPQGVFGRVAPRESDRADIATALDFLAVTGRFDMGQAVVVADQQVLGVEAAEGTDALLARIAQLRANRRIRLPHGTGVLVKAPKPQQDRRFDLPSIGPRTIEGVAQASLAGLAVVAGETVVADPDDVVTAADKHGVFAIGVPAGSIP